MYKRVNELIRRQQLEKNKLIRAGIAMLKKNCFSDDGTNEKKLVPIQCQNIEHFNEFYE